MPTLKMEVYVYSLSMFRRKYDPLEHIVMMEVMIEFCGFNSSGARLMRPKVRFELCSPCKEFMASYAVVIREELN